MPSRQQKLLERTALDKLGYESFRPGQKEAIESIVSGRDTLAVMPTGAGKSAIYQLAATLRSGPAVIVSPLIALQKDQVEKLEIQDLGEAALVNSTTGETNKRETLDDVESGEIGFVFVTPEQLAKPEVLESMRESKPALFVVDEAHCISEWGHDFRPDYLKLGKAAEDLGRPPILALTATASAQVREEIIQRLGMREPRVIVAGFNRPNIWLGVETFSSLDAKLEALLHRVEWSDKPGIVYVSSRRHAEEIASALAERGINCAHYHGGMPSKLRHPVQDDFMAGRLDVIVATSAFGMGVDKPDIHFVFHYEAPHSIDAYYQEIGRSGRDGAEARAILFYRPEDLGIHKFFAGGNHLNGDAIEMVADAVQDHPATPEEVAEATGLSRAKVAKALQRLEDAELDVEEAVCESERRHEAELLRIECMKTYAELVGCRRQYLLGYFGDEVGEACGFCDQCDTRKKQEQTGHEPFAPGTRVAHKEWGEGIVQSYRGDEVEVLFENEELKSMVTEFVTTHQILKPA